MLIDKQALVSIIVPVYNVEMYLEKCVESLINQTYKNIEILLIDDGSKDASSILCDKIAEKDSRIQVVHKENGGLSDARNVGIQMAKGKYLGFVDSDDWVNINMFESLVMACEQKKTQIAVCGMMRVYRNREDAFTPPFSETLTQEKALTELFKGEKFGDQACTKIYRKELFKDIEYPKGKQFEDIYTTYKLFLKADRVAVIDQPLYYYRQRKSSITGNGYNIKKRHIIDALQSIKKNEIIYKNEQWQSLLCQRIYDATCWTLLDMFQSNAVQQEILLEEKKLYKTVRESRGKIVKESRHFSCRMLALISILGFKNTKMISSSAIVEKAIRKKYAYFE